MNLATFLKEWIFMTRKPWIFSPMHSNYVIYWVNTDTENPGESTRRKQRNFGRGSSSCDEKSWKMHIHACFPQVFECVCFQFCDVFQHFPLGWLKVLPWIWVWVVCLNKLLICDSESKEKKGFPPSRICSASISNLAIRYRRIFLNLKENTRISKAQVHVYSRIHWTRISGTIVAWFWELPCREISEPWV